MPFNLEKTIWVQNQIEYVNNLSESIEDLDMVILLVMLKFVGVLHQSHDIYSMSIAQT